MSAFVNSDTHQHDSLTRHLNTNDASSIMNTMAVVISQMRLKLPSCKRENRWKKINASIYKTEQSAFLRLKYVLRSTKTAPLQDGWNIQMPL
jgi:hypothetical protein